MPWSYCMYVFQHLVKNSCRLLCFSVWTSLDMFESQFRWQTVVVGSSVRNIFSFFLFSKFYLQGSLCPVTMDSNRLTWDPSKVNTPLSCYRVPSNKIPQPELRFQAVSCAADTRFVAWKTTLPIIRVPNTRIRL